MDYMTNLFGHIFLLNLDIASKSFSTQYPKQLLSINQSCQQAKISAILLENSSVEVWGPPPGGNPTSIQAGGVYPRGQHRGPSVTLAWKLGEKKTKRMAGFGGQLWPQQSSDHLEEMALNRDPGTRGCSAVNSGLPGFPRKPGPERLVFLWGPRL